jgi:uncharacterized protein
MLTANQGQARHKSINLFKPFLLLQAFGFAGLTLLLLGSTSPKGTTTPSFDCSKVAKGSTEALICKDKELALLDRQMASVFQAALKKTEPSFQPRLRTEQIGWIKGRNDCWKEANQKSCVSKNYQLRIAELQAKYRLLPGTGPIRYICDGNAANEVLVTFFKTNPPSLIAERGDSVSMMFLQPNQQGSKYQGRNESLLKEQNKAQIIWGYNTPVMKCIQAP